MILEVWDGYRDVGSLQPLGLPGGGQEVVVVWALLDASAVFQVKGQQAGEAGAAPAPCQQGRDGLPVEHRSAASRNNPQVRSPAADWIQISPGVHGHLTQKVAAGSKRKMKAFIMAEVKGQPPPDFIHTPHCEGGGVTAPLSTVTNDDQLLFNTCLWKESLWSERI